MGSHIRFSWAGGRKGHPGEPENARWCCNRGGEAVLEAGTRSLIPSGRVGGSESVQLRHAWPFQTP